MNSFRQTKLTSATLALITIGLSSAPTVAEERSVTLGVDGMWCPACGYFVQETLERVPGVKAVEVSMWERVAYVTFDDEITSIDALTIATGDIGFVSIPIGEGS